MEAAIQLRNLSFPFHSNFFNIIISWRLISRHFFTHIPFGLLNSIIGRQDDKLLKISLNARQFIVNLNINSCFL